MTDIQFARLVDVPVTDILELLNEPRNRRHMPLAEPFSETTAADWVRQKDAQWEQHGYGPWAIVISGKFAGWGGFQLEDYGADFALVLFPRYWGRGSDVTLAALQRGFEELGLEEVFIALPYTRNPGRAVARLGFLPAGEVTFGKSAFRRFGLTRSAWEAYFDSSGDVTK